MFHLDGRPGQLAGHAVTVRSQLVHTMGKDVQASGGKSGILRAGHGAQQRKSLRTKCAHGMQGGGDTRILQGAVQMAGDDFLPYGRRITQPGRQGISFGQLAAIQPADAAF